MNFDDHETGDDLATQSATYLAILSAMKLPSKPTNSADAAALARAELFAFFPDLTLPAYELADLLLSDASKAREETGLNHVEFPFNELCEFVGDDLASLSIGLAGGMSNKVNGVIYWRDTIDRTECALVDISPILNALESST